METPVLIALIIGGIVVAIVVLILVIPQIRNYLFSSKKENSKESAQLAVNEIITKPKENKLDEEIKKEKYQNYLIKREKELDIILSSDDIEPLIIQLIQDEDDNKKR